MTSFSGREHECLSEAFALIDELQHLTTTEDISERLSNALAGFGFHAFLMTRLPPRTERIDPYILIMSWPREWLSRYSLQRYYGHEPVAQNCFTTLRPFIWSRASWKGWDPHRARQVMNEATDFGLKDGVIVPMHDISGRQASLSLAASSLDLPPSALKAIHLVSLYAFASTDDASTVRPLLSSREREVLTWTAQGKSTWDVGQILGISQQTVATHLKNSKFKLDTTTVTHTVVQALRRREIEL